MKDDILGQVNAMNLKPSEKELEEGMHEVGRMCRYFFDGLLLAGFNEGQAYGMTTAFMVTMVGSLNSAK